MIKVSDFGLTEDIYARNYFRQVHGGDEEPPVKLPVRWMAVESLHDGIFSEKTDVVRYTLATISKCPSYILLLMQFAVVIWCDVLGGVLTWKNALSWNRSLLSCQTSRERGKTGETSQ